MKKQGFIMPKSSLMTPTNSSRISHNFASANQNSASSVIESIKSFANSNIKETPNAFQTLLPSTESLFTVRSYVPPKTDSLSKPIKNRNIENMTTPKSAKVMHSSAMTTSARQTIVQPAERFSIFVLSESRAREVGMAALNIHTHEIFITQFADNQHYSYTAELIHAFAPTVIVFPNTAKESTMVKVICVNFPELPKQFAERKYFSETHGLKIYNDAIKYRVVIDIERKFTCLASLAALIRYAEVSEAIILAPQATKIEYYFLEHIMHIDYRSSLKLELVINLQQFTSTNSLFSLFETLTIGGRRLLRMSILHPLSDPVLIQKRLDLVSEILDNEHILLSLHKLLPHFKEFELYTGRFSTNLRAESDIQIKQIVYFCFINSYFYRPKPFLN